MPDEGILKRMQHGRATTAILRIRRRLGQAFDRQYLPALRLERRVDARIDRLSVNDDGAAAALCLIAANLGAGQPQAVTQYFGQVAAGWYIESVFPAIHGQSETCHVCTPVGVNYRGS